MQFETSVPALRFRPTTFLFRGHERKSGQIREGMVSAMTKRSARRALQRDGLRSIKLELA